MLWKLNRGLSSGSKLVTEDRVHGLQWLSNAQTCYKRQSWTMAAAAKSIMKQLKITIHLLQASIEKKGVCGGEICDSHSISCTIQKFQKLVQEETKKLLHIAIPT